MYSYLYQIFRYISSTLDLVYFIRVELIQFCQLDITVNSLFYFPLKRSNAYERECTLNLPRS